MLHKRSWALSPLGGNVTMGRISDGLKNCASTGDQTLVSHNPGECHTARRPRPPRQHCCHIRPLKEKACPHAFRTRRSYWPPNAHNPGKCHTSRPPRQLTSVTLTLFLLKYFFKSLDVNIVQNCNLCIITENLDSTCNIL